MKLQNMRYRFFFVILLLLLTFPGYSSVQKQSVRVIVENTSIRLKPDLQSEIIRTPPLGSVFEVEKKEGDWYEIKFKSELGVFLPGFIHEMYVELVNAEVISQAPIKKSPVPKKKVVKVPPLPPLSKTSPKTSGKRVDFALRAGYMTGYGLTETAVYTDSLSSGTLQNATVNGQIMMGLKNPISLDGELNFFFLKGLGVQLRFDFNSSAELTDDSLSTYDLSWNWTTRGPFSRNANWDTTGEVSLFVLSGNLVYKIETGGFFTPVLSGGISYFSGNAVVNTTTAYTTTWESDGTRYVDYFKLPTKVDASLSGIGFNFGGGFDLNFSSSIALSLDVRYLLKSEVSEPWTLQTGKYYSNINTSTNWSLTFDQEWVDELAAEITPFFLNPSFLKIAAGIRIRF